MSVLFRFTSSNYTLVVSTRFWWKFSGFKHTKLLSASSCVGKGESSQWEWLPGYNTVSLTVDHSMSRVW